MGRRAWRFAIVAMAIFSAYAPGSRAQAPGAVTPRGDARSPKVVQVAIVGGKSDAAALEASLRELFGRINLTAAPEGADGPPDAILARVRIDLSSSSSASLIVTDGQTGEVVESRSVARDASAAIVREEIAHAVQSAVASKLLADADRKNRPAPPPPAPPPPAPPPPRVPLILLQPISIEADTPGPARSSWIALDVSTLVGGGPFAGGAGAVARVGGGLAVASRRGLRPSLGVTVTYALPFEASSALVTSQVTSHSDVVAGRGLVSIELARTSFLALDIGAGGGFDAVTTSPQSAVLPSSALGMNTLRTDAVLTGALEARIPLATSVVIVIDATADYDLNPRRYVLEQAGTDSDVLTPWRVRPTLLAGFAFTALGEGLFERGRQ